MKGKTAVALFIVVFLLIAAVIGTYLTDRDGKPEPPAVNTQAPTDGPVVVAPPEPSAPSYTYVPSPPTQTPSTPTPATPAPTPAPTPEPVVIPTPIPEPVQQNLGSGSFSSQTGVGLNLKADWSARTVSASQAEITVSVSITSYSLHLAAVPGSIHVNLGGQYVSLDAPAVDYDGTSALNTPMASKTFTVELSEGAAQDFTLEVVWSFGGTYQQVELDDIECGGRISLAR